MNEYVGRYAVTAENIRKLRDERDEALDERDKWDAAYQRLAVERQGLENVRAEVESLERKLGESRQDADSLREALEHAEALAAVVARIHDALSPLDLGHIVAMRDAIASRGATWNCMCDHIVHDGPCPNGRWEPIEQ